jgi:hypothetical protein
MAVGAPNLALVDLALQTAEAGLDGHEPRHVASLLADMIEVENHRVRFTAVDAGSRRKDRADVFSVSPT